MDTQARITVDCDISLGPLERIWASVGYDEINWTYTRRGKALFGTLAELAETPYYVRNHNALTSGNGLSEPARGSTNVYHEMPDGTVRYDWSILDQVYDTFVASGFRPLIELGFLPHDLVPSDYAGADWTSDVGNEVYESQGLWKYPPKDDGRWSDLIFQFVRHLVERYGQAEVEHWCFELWNEPDIANYWRGTLADYCHLYDCTVQAATAALPEIRIGGPATTGPARPEARAFLEGFLRHVTEGTNTVTGLQGTRIDFVSFHTKGAHYARRRYYNHALPIPRESPSSAAMVADIEAGLQTLAGFPALAGLPVLVDECDPAVGTIYGVFDNPNFVVTNNEYYPTFHCALVRRILDLNRRYPNRVALVTAWAFYMEGKRYFEGNRTLVTNENIEKPVLNAFRMLARLGHTRLAVESSATRAGLAEGDPGCEVSGLAASSYGKVAVLAWHQADPWWLEGTAQVELRLEHLPFAGAARVSHYRIDGSHSNAYAEWVRQGRPQDPSPAQVEQIKAHQQLELLEPPANVRIEADGSLVLGFELPLYATSLIEVVPA